MIRYSLICDSEHEFESWFPDSASYEMQARRGFVACPACGSAKVRKALMAPRIRTGKKAEAAAAAPAEQARPVAGEAVQMAPGRDAGLRAMLRALRDHVKANAEDVGDNFAETARKMHYGEVEHRSIYGRSTLEDARALHEEGVEFQALPTLPDDRN